MLVLSLGVCSSLGSPERRAHTVCSLLNDSDNSLAVTPVSSSHQKLLFWGDGEERGEEVDREEKKMACVSAGSGNIVISLELQTLRRSWRREPAGQGPGLAGTGAFGVSEG